MKLQVDIGNTKIKWRVVKSNKVYESGFFEHGFKFDYDHVFLGLDVTPQEIEVVSVIVSEEQRFLDWSLRYWGVTPLFAKVTKNCAGVVNGYAQVEQMGPDRWLALLAAFNDNKGDCVIVDAGSACTIDAVLKTGRHLGGYIVPGLMMMCDALFRDTDRVKVSSINYDASATMGDSTQNAVSAGLQQMVLGLIVLAIDEVIDSGAIQPKVIISGGDGKRLQHLLSQYLVKKNRADVGAIVYTQDLVFEGLRFVFNQSPDPE